MDKWGEKRKRHPYRISAWVCARAGIRTYSSTEDVSICGNIHMCHELPPSAKAALNFELSAWFTKGFVIAMMHRIGDPAPGVKGFIGSLVH